MKKTLMEKEMICLQKELEEEKTEHRVLQTKHETVMERFDKFKVVEVQIEDLSKENSRLIQIKEDFETKVERLETALEKHHKEMSILLSEKQDLKSKLENLENMQTLYDESKTVAESLQKQLYELQDVRDDRDLIKSQYERLNQDFENKIIPLQAHKSTINDESATILKGKADMEAELEDTKNKHKELKSINELLTSELNETKDQMKHIETEKQNLNEEP